MSMSKLAGAILGSTVLLAGCATETAQTGSVTPVAATAATPAPACTRGAIDSQRAFVLCPVEAATEADAVLALRRPADLSLDIASIAAEYGVARQSVSGVEAATYARIVGKTPESKARTSTDDAAENAITLDGRKFRKVSLSTDDKKPVVLFVQR